MPPCLSPGRLCAIALIVYCALAPAIAEAGPGPCPQPQYTIGTQAWQTCMIRHVGQVAYDAGQRSVDNASNISYLMWKIDVLEQENADLRADNMALQHQASLLDQRLSALEERANRNDAQWTMHIELTETRQDAELEALREDFDWNNRALGDTQDAHQGTQDRVTQIERDLYGIPDTDYGGISAWIDLLTYHVTGQHGYALWWGDTVPEQIEGVNDNLDVTHDFLVWLEEEVATRLETLEDICLP